MPRALTCVSIAAVLALASGGHAQLVDRVVAFVDDEVILLSEVRERAEPTLDARADAEPLAVYRQVLVEMIDAALVAREAERRGVEVTSEDVRGAMEGIATQNGMSSRELERALTDRGWSLPSYEALLREQLVRVKVIQLRLLNGPRLTDEVVRAEWERRAASFEGERRYRVVELSEPVGANAAQARARLEERVDQLRSGSATREAVGAIEAGWVQASELAEETAAVLGALEPGELGPIREREGRLVVLQLVDSGETAFPTFEELRDTIRGELHAEMLRVAEEELLAELRARATIARRL